jgi:hypothetical protein
LYRIELQRELQKKCGVSPESTLLGIKKDRVTGGWRRLHNEELHDLYCSPNIIRVIVKEDEMGGACSTYREKKNTGRVLMRKREGTRILGRPALRRVRLKWIR